MKVNIVEAKAFLKELFHAQKRVKKATYLINMSEKFTPIERAKILGDKEEAVSIMADTWNTKFSADILDPKTRGAILNMGSRSVYINLNNSPQSEINKKVFDLIYNPYTVKVIKNSH